jgi:hypothetical protein
MDPCVSVKCVNPPIPPHSHLKIGGGQNQFNFNENVTYVCETGYYFQHDKDLETFDVLCLPGGTFAAPNSWPACRTGSL